LTLNLTGGYQTIFEYTTIQKIGVNKIFKNVFEELTYAHQVRFIELKKR